jgi:hypothetical protein
LITADAGAPDRPIGPVAPAPAAAPHPGRRRHGAALALASGVASAVVAIVAIVVFGDRTGSGPAATPDPDSARTMVTVESTGANGTPTVTTVTAQVSAVNGRLVALVTDGNGHIQQLAVVAAAVPTSSTDGASSPTSDSPRVSSRPATEASASADPPPTSSGLGYAPAPVPADPGDVATVVTGLTTLTGWVPVSTG